MVLENEFKITFLPLFASGHIIPIVDMARQFARHGATVTVVATPSNARIFQKEIDRDFTSGHRIQTHIEPFPSAEVGLPPGIENFSDLTSLEMLGRLYRGFMIIDKQIERFLHQNPPDCIVSDLAHPWTTDTAAELGIPRLVFHVSNFLAYSAEHCMVTYKPHEKVSSDAEKFTLPGLPHKIEMTRRQQPDFFVKGGDPFTKLLERQKEAERRSYGSVMNTFYELDGVYLEHYKKITGVKAWGLGPVSLAVNKDAIGKIDRGNKSAVESGELLQWLSSKDPDSVLYISFGSMTRFPAAQIAEIAHGLEASGQNFIWVIRKKDKSEGEDEEGLPEGFEERVKESKKGLVVRVWAPQLLILEHESTGGFLTHCGWNSSIEGVSAGQPMITWPVSSEQFYNEQLLTAVWKVGVAVGAKRWWNMRDELEEKDIVSREEVEKAVRFLLGDGEEASAIRKRARELGAAAKKAVSAGGSSENNMVSLMNELKWLKLERDSKQGRTA